MALHFFDLPTEIRHQIYGQLLVSKGDGEMPSGRICQGKRPQQTVEPAMLRVCKQMHDETAPILYRQNEFCVHADFSRFKQFLLVAGKDNAALIRMIWFCTTSILDLQDDISETVDLSRGPLQGLEKVTSVYSGYLPSYDPTEPHHSTGLDLLYVRGAIAESPKSIVDRGGLAEFNSDGEFKIQMSILFAQP